MPAWAVGVRAALMYVPGAVMRVVPHEQQIVLLGSVEGAEPVRGNTGPVASGALCLIVSRHTSDTDCEGRDMYIVMCGRRFGWLCHDDMV